MTSNFDFSAFIDSHSPNGLDVNNSDFLTDTLDDGLSKAHYSYGDGANPSTLISNGWPMPTLDNGALSAPQVQSNNVGAYSSLIQEPFIDRLGGTVRPAPQAAQSLGPESYRAAIAAHHSHLLRGGRAVANVPVPSRPMGLAGIRSTNTVSQSAAVNDYKGLTLQERRRLSRKIAAEKPISQSSGSGSNSRNKYSGSSEEGQTSHTSVRSGKRHSRRHHRSSRHSSSAKVDSASSSIKKSIPADENNQRQHQHQHQHQPTEEELESLAGGNKIGEIYSASGFDMLGALMRVSCRPNPKIAIGSVDLSCSFTVSDARHPEHPLIYCSETFTLLTGYELNEIIGRNCRFLQSPTGSINKGAFREHTDQAAVHHLSKNLQVNQECQASFINYRKDGTPFINLVTIIPIGWNNPNEVDFFVGFQVDLMEQPGAILERTPDGLYVVNYGSATVPVPAALVQTDPDSDEEKQTLMTEELTQLIEGGTNDTKLWSRLLLDNSHDLVHVLSLKGNFLYVSPSSERLLGFKPHEMVGKSISEFCHPSDLVPVFRELKDSTSNASISAAAKRFTRADGSLNPPTRGGSGQSGPRVNLLMRMRHKTAGYIWIESCGKLHLEQGKGRKVVISSGRCRPVYNLPHDKVSQMTQIKEASFWTKASREGLILNSTAPCLDVVGITAHNMSGQHFGRMAVGPNASSLMEAIQGSVTKSVHHEMLDEAGNRVSVISTVYPSATASPTHDPRTIFIHTQLSTSKPAASAKKNSNSLKSSLGADGAMDKGMKAGAGGFFPARPNPNNGSNNIPVDATITFGSDLLDSELASEMASSANVFDELSTDRSSSWIFELHQLKNSNRRLRETLRSLNHRSRPGATTQQAGEDGNASSEETGTSSASGGGVNHNAHAHAHHRSHKGKERAVESSSLQAPALAHLQSFSKSNSASSGSGSGSGSSNLFDSKDSSGRVPSDDTEMTSQSGGSSGGSDEMSQAQRDHAFMMQVDAAINGGPQGPVVQDQEGLSASNQSHSKKRKNRS